jgi:hypothetical protein
LGPIPERTDRLVVRYDERGWRTEVAMPLMYLPLIIYSATLSMLFDVLPRKRK